MTKALRPMWYLACPYSHPSEKIRKARFQAVSRVCGELMKKGIVAFSPITHNHPVKKLVELPSTWEFWLGFDFEFLRRSEKLIVLRLPRWNESTGVTKEIEEAKECGIEIDYIDPLPIDVAILTALEAEYQREISMPS